MRHTECQGYRLSRIYFKMHTTVVKKVVCTTARRELSTEKASVWSQWLTHEITNPALREIGQVTKDSWHTLSFCLWGFRTQTSCLQTEPIRGFTTVRRAHSGTVSAASPSFFFFFTLTFFFNLKNFSFLKKQSCYTEHSFVPHVEHLTALSNCT